MRLPGLLFAIFMILFSHASLAWGAEGGFVPDMGISQSLPVWVPEGKSRTAPVSDPEDFLCQQAPKGKIAALPAPFDRWMVRVCTRQGQALVPVQGEAWVAHGTRDIVSILAMPPDGLPPRVTGAFDERYDIRFHGFQGGRTEGERHERALALLHAATPQAKLTSPAEIWQLDASSNVDDTRYNIFLYLPHAAAKGGRPNHLIVCLAQCRQALYLDVLTGADAEAALR